MRRLIIQLVEINQLAEFLLDPLFCQAKFLQRIVLFTFEMGRRPFARLTAHGRFLDKKGCKTADQAGSRVASAQWRSDKNHPTDFRPVSKEQFLAKILARFRREQHFVRRPAENLHLKLIAAAGKKQRLMQPPMLCPITTIGLSFGNCFSTSSSSSRRIAAEDGYG